PGVGAVHEDAMQVGIDLETRHRDLLGPADLRGDAAPPEDGLDARHELAHAEGLCNVVVGAHLQHLNLVLLGGPGTHDDDRALGAPRAQLAQHLPAVEAREHQVEHNSVGPLESRLAKGAVAVLDAFDSHAGVPQVGADRPRDHAVVLDDEHARLPPVVVRHDATPAGTRGAAGGLTGGMAMRHASPTARTWRPAQRARAPRPGSSRMTSII